MNEIAHQDEQPVYGVSNASDYDPLSIVDDAVVPLTHAEAPEHQPEASEPPAGESDGALAVTDDLPPLDGDDIEMEHWRRSVEAYVSTKTEPFMVDDVLVSGFHFAPPLERADQMRVAAILRERGFEGQHRRIDGVRAHWWSSPTMVAFAAPQPSQPATVAVRDEQHVEQVAPREGGSIVGDAVESDDATQPAPSAPVEPAQPSEAAEPASTRYRQLSARQIDIKRKLADAQRMLHFAKDARKQAALAAAEGAGFVAEAAYEKAVIRHKEAGAHVEKLTEALEQIGKDLQRASVYAEAERRVQQCKEIRDAARAVEAYGPRIEGLLAELGKAVSGYLHDINVIYQKSWPVLTGAREVAAPLTEPVAYGLLGHFLRSSGLDPAFFTELTSYGMHGLLRYETPSQIADMQLGNITARLADNYLSLVEVSEAEPDFVAEPETSWAQATPGHEHVPAGIFPTQSTIEED